MTIPPWIKGWLDEERIGTIRQAVAAAEKKTRGEIRPMIVRASTQTGHMPLLVTLILAVAGLLILDGLNHTLAGGTPAWSPLAILALAWLAGRLLAGLGPVQRLLMHPRLRAHQVGMRAELEFFEAGLDKTEGDTGILLFVSLAEHQAVVLADKGIAGRLPPDTWDGVVQLLLQGIRRGDMAAGFISAIDECGRILAEHFPIAPGDVNELPDTLIIKE